MPLTGSGHLHAFIRRGNPERRGAAAGDPRDGDAVAVHLGTALQIIDGPHPIPAFDARGRVPARLPPPTIVFVSAMMNGRDLAELQGVDDQADITMRRKPHPVMLERRLVAIATAPRMTANVKHRRQFGTGLRVLWQIEIAGDIKSGPALKVQLLDAKAFLPLDHTRHFRQQRRSLRQRPKPEHLEILLPQLTPPCLPLLAVGDALEKPLHPAAFASFVQIRPRSWVVAARCHFEKVPPQWRP
jgi:hypothetical protein